MSVLGGKADLTVARGPLPERPKADMQLGLKPTFGTEQAIFIILICGG